MERTHTACPLHNQRWSSLPQRPGRSSNSVLLVGCQGAVLLSRQAFWELPVSQGSRGFRLRNISGILILLQFQLCKHRPQKKRKLDYQPFFPFKNPLLFLLSISLRTVLAQDHHFPPTIPSPLHFKPYNISF